MPGQCCCTYEDPVFRLDCGAEFVSIIAMEYQLWSDAGQIAFSLWLWDFVCSFIVKWSFDRIYFLFGVAGSIYQFNCFVGKFLIRCIPIP